VLCVHQCPRPEATPTGPGGMPASCANLRTVLNQGYWKDISLYKVAEERLAIGAEERIR
jgi:hypothetical protein